MIPNPLSSSGMKGKVVLVTGSTAGLGRELVAAFHRAGACVIVNGRNPENLQETAKKLGDGGRPVSFVQGDVSSPEDCRRIIGTCIREYGKLDILVNNAGTGANGAFADTIPQATRKVMETNFLGSVYPTYYALPHLIKTRGSIVFISSLAGLHGLPFTYAYSTSKMALTALIQSLRIELAGTGVHTGIMYVGFLKNGPLKRIISCDNQLVPATGKPVKFSMSLSQASMEILKAIEKRKAIKIFGALGKFLYLCNRIWPGVVRKILSRSMRFMKAAYTPMQHLHVPANS